MGTRKTINKMQSALDAKGHTYKTNTYQFYSGQQGSKRNGGMEMGKLSKKDMEELRETCSLGNEYSGTEEIVSEIVYDTLEEMDKSGMKTIMRSADEIGLVDDKEFATLDDFVRIFWEKSAEKILNVVETQ